MEGGRREKEKEGGVEKKGEKGKEEGGKEEKEGGEKREEGRRTEALEASNFFLKV